MSTISSPFASLKLTMRFLNPVLCVALLLVGGCADEPTATAAPRVLAPSCEQPAPLDGVFDARAPLMLVVFRDSVAAEAETNRLAAQYSFAPTHRWSFGFAAMLSPEVVASLRCAASVRVVEYDAIATYGGR